MSRLAALPFKITTDQLGDIDIISVHGELDLSTAPQLQEALGPAIRQSSTVLLDLADCDFIDSSGIALIIIASRRAEGANGHGPPPFLLCGLREQVRRVLEIAGVVDQVPTVGTREEALAEFS